MSSSWLCECVRKCCPKREIAKLATSDGDAVRKARHGHVHESCEYSGCPPKPTLRYNEGETNATKHSACAKAITHCVSLPGVVYRRQPAVPQMHGQLGEVRTVNEYKAMPLDGLVGRRVKHLSLLDQDQTGNDAGQTELSCLMCSSLEVVVEVVFLGTGRFSIVEYSGSTEHHVRGQATDALLPFAQIDSGSKVACAHHMEFEQEPPHIMLSAATVVMQSSQLADETVASLVPTLQPGQSHTF